MKKIILILVLSAFSAAMAAQEVGALKLPAVF